MILDVDILVTVNVVLRLLEFVLGGSGAKQLLSQARDADNH